MLLGECYAGEDAEVLFEAMKSDWSAEDEDVISNLVVYVKQYKETPVQVTGATALWDSDMGMYLLTIPAAYVPASGSFDIVVKGAGDIDDVKIRLGVNTADSKITDIKAKTDLLTLAAIKTQATDAISEAALATASGLSGVPNAVWNNEVRVLTSTGAGGATAQEVWEYETRALTTYNGPTLVNMREQMDDAIIDANLATKTDITNIDVTVDGTDLVTLDTVITLPSGRQKSFNEVLNDVYKYRKY